MSTTRLVIEVTASIREKTVLALAGDASALGAVFEYYRPRLLAHALRICGNSPVARDAVQDTFIAVFTRLSTLRDPLSFYPWLKKILVNNCYILLRRERSVPLNDTHARRDDLLQHSIDVNLEAEAERQQLFDALATLSEELRSCLLLRYFTDFNSYESIAMALGIPVGTVRSRLAAARTQLAASFRQKGDASDATLREARRWSEYYLNIYGRMYDDSAALRELLNHHDPGLNIRFTSGASGRGRKLLEGEVQNDFDFGSRFIPGEVITCGNVTVLEGHNVNHGLYPDRCAPHTAMVLFRGLERIETVHIFDSQRP